MYIDIGDGWGAVSDRGSVVSGVALRLISVAPGRPSRGVEVSGGDRADGVWGRFRFDDNRRNYRQIIVKLSSKAVG